MSKVEGVLYVLFVSLVFLLTCFIFLAYFNNKITHTFKDFIEGWSAFSAKVSFVWLLFFFVPFIISTLSVSAEPKYSLNDANSLLVLMALTFGLSALSAMLLFPFALLLFATGTVTSVASLRYPLGWRKRATLTILNIAGFLSTLFIGMNFPFNFQGVG